MEKALGKQLKDRTVIRGNASSGTMRGGFAGAKVSNTRVAFHIRHSQYCFLQAMRILGSKQIADATEAIFADTAACRRSPEVEKDAALATP